MPIIKDIPLPERTPNPIRAMRKSRQQERTNRSVAGKSIFVPLGDSIQTAIDSIAKNGGGVVRLQSGTYFPDNNIRMRSYCSLIGDGQSKTVIDFNGQPYSVLLPADEAGVGNRNMEILKFGVINSATHGVWLEPGSLIGVIIDNINSNYNGGSGFYMNSETGDSIIIDFCSAQNNTLNGFTLHNCDFINMRHNQASSNTLNGMAIDTFTTNVRIYSFKASFNTLSGLSIDSGAWVHVEGLRSFSNTLYGVHLNNTANSNIITNSRIFSNTSDGVRIDGDSNRNRITSSDIISNSGWGVRINAANCDKNLLAFDDLGSTANTSGTLSDAGTGTVSVNHIT